MKNKIQLFIQKYSSLYTIISIINKRIWLLKQPKLRKSLLDKEIADFSEQGIQKRIDGKQIIVSLTSFPARINDVKYTIFSLMQQTIKPNKIILWLGEDKFKLREKDLPKDLLKLRENGLLIKFVKDIGSYTKLIPTLQQYPGSLIITVDDDIFYPKTLVEDLYTEYSNNPDCIVAHRVHRVRICDKKIAPYSDWDFAVKTVPSNPSYLNFLTGVGGVMYDSTLLYKDVLREDIFMRYCPKADDIWFYVMAVLQGTKIKMVPKGAYKLLYVNPDKEISGENTLLSHNVREGGNDVQFNSLCELYPEVLKRLLVSG